MNSHVNLIVSVRARHQFIRISDLHLYHLIAAVTPVVGIQMLECSINCRASVAVSDVAAANEVIEKLNGAHTELGSVRVSVAEDNGAVNGLACNAYASKKESKENLKSVKDSLKFSKSDFCKENGQQKVYALFGNAKQARRNVDVWESLNSKLGDSNQRLVGESATSGTKQVEDNTCNTSLLLATQKSNIQNGKNLSECPDEPQSIRITHDEPAQLTEKRVLKAFRRFGRVFAMSFDADNACWTLEYSSQKEIGKVNKVLANGKLFGYRLAHEEPHKASIIDASPTACSLRYTPSSKDVNHGRPCAVKTPAHGATIRIDIHGKQLTLESLCLNVARIHVPVQISLGFDSVRRTHFCVADFRFAHEAAEVLVHMSQSRRDLTCKFAD